MTYSMNIRQAARWADRKDALYIGGDFENPLCAVYASSDSPVLVIGTYDKCRDFIKARTDTPYIPMRGSYYKCRDSSDYLRFEALETVLEELAESEGEARCVPDLCEQREWS